MPTIHEDCRKPFCRPPRSSDETDRGLDTPPLLSLDDDTRNPRPPRCPGHRGLPGQPPRTRSPRSALPRVLNVEQAQSFLQWRLTKNNRGGNLQHPKLATPSEKGDRAAPVQHARSFALLRDAWQPAGCSGRKVTGITAIEHLLVGLREFLAPHVLNLAVIAHICHTHTRYDELLSRTGDQELSRASVREEIEKIRTNWSGARI